MDSRTYSTKLIFVSLLTLLLTACDNSEQATTPSVSSATDQQKTYTPALGDRLISASIGDASNLIPMIAGDNSSHEIASQMYLSLLKHDKELNITGQLAQSWNVSDDMLSITFRLQQGVRWSDGKPFTAKDCAFTLQLIQNEHTQSPYKSDYDKIKSFETPDDYTFIVHYSEAFSPALSSWIQLAILPKHVFEGENIMKTSLSRQPKATLGPYFLTNWQSQQSITMSANPDYFDGHVWIKERMTRIIPDPATQFLELSAGNLDMMNLSPTQYTRLFNSKKQLKENYKRYQYLSFGYTYLGFNLQRKPFDDPKVREAIAYAIDRQELVDGVLFGLGEVIATPYKPGTYWVNHNIKPRPYDAEKAKILLREAGWEDSDGDGILDKNGKALSFTVLTNNGNKKRADTATIAQQRLKQIGVNVKVRLVEWSAFIENFINTRNFDAVILGWGLTPEPDQYSMWHSSQTGARQFNFLSYNNPKVDAALVAARQTFDIAERKKHYDILQQEMFNDVPLVFLYAAYSLPAIHKRVQGIKPAPAGIGYNAEHWFVPAEIQKYQVGMRSH